MIKLGIDIGGTTIKGIRFDDKKPVKFATSPTQGKAGREAILVALFTVLDDLWDGTVSFIGIASAGNINPVTGEVVYATDNLMGWTGLRLKEIVENRYHVECKIENDAIAALIAEASILNQNDNVTMITLGTGVGGASIVNGSIVRGKEFDGGRWGHIPLVCNGIHCNCGSYGCAEQYLSATALLQKAKDQIPTLQNVAELFMLYLDGNKVAIEILQEYGMYLNMLLVIINRSIHPDTIILGGGMTLSQDVLEELLDDTIRNVSFAHFKEQAGMYGASIL